MQRDELIELMDVLALLRDPEGDVLALAMAWVEFPYPRRGWLWSKTDVDCWVALGGLDRLKEAQDALDL